MLSITLAELAPFIAVVFGAAGIGGFVIALLKVRPEAGQVAVEASEGALIVQTGVITTLREENKRLSDRLEELERQVGDVGLLVVRLERLENERNQLRNENVKLRERVKHLEDQLRKMADGG
jgi:hypothetical protein